MRWQRSGVTMTNYHHPTQSAAIWRVMVEVGAKFQPCSIAWYASTDYRDCFDYLETRQHLANKKRKLFVRQQGTKFKHRYFDERFYAALQIGQDVTADEFYDEPTTDDKARVDIHNKFRVAQWRGIRRL